MSNLPLWTRSEIAMVSWLSAENQKIKACSKHELHATNWWSSGASDGHVAGCTYILMIQIWHNFWWCS